MDLLWVEKVHADDDVCRIACDLVRRHSRRVTKILQPIGNQFGQLGEGGRELEQCWSRVPTWRRQAVMEDILELAESDPVLSFEAVCRIGIQDADPRVRELAVQTLWEYDAVELIPAFLHLVVKDENVNVRMASAIALGSFVYLGELEEIREATLREVEDRLLEVVNGKDNVVVR